MSSFTASPRRRRGAGMPPARAARKLGSARQSQLITTYGVGSMIAIDNESFIISGLDSWDTSGTQEVWERRLARLLNVRTFKLPPAPDPDRGRDGVRASRFPNIYSCPSCNDLQHFRKFNSSPGKAECGNCLEDLVPSRFVMACNHGHLDDFPYWKWVHKGRESVGAAACGGTLRLRTSGATASLRSILISCTCGAAEVSMEGAFRRRALDKLKIRCTGRRPWLKDAQPEPHCGESPRTMQRGSSAAWHPVVRSAISIPPWGEGLHKLIGPIYPLVKGVPDLAIKHFLEVSRTLVHHPTYTVEAAIDLIRSLEAQDAEGGGEAEPAPSEYTDLRRDEYKHLRLGNPEEDGEFEQDFVCEAPTGDMSVLKPLGLEGPMLVKRLREVRVLETFTRVDPPTEADAAGRRAPLSLGKDVDWLPAIEVSGEGTFLRLDEPRLRHWEQLPGPIARAELIRANHNALLRERAGSHDKPVPESPVSPRYLLLHTLAHVLINEWSLDGGYPAAALRERLYSAEDLGADAPAPMAGLLLYTATSDSAGSLGGIVAQGDPARLRLTLTSALRRAEWCSNDPLCMESRATGADSVNLAACHACVLLPETSCENNNSLLDRALLIGTPDGRVPGFFADLRG